MTYTNAQLAKMTLDTATLRRDQGLITMPQYRAFLYVWHADPTKWMSAPMNRRPFGEEESAIIDELLALTGIDEFAKRDAWTQEDRDELVKEQMRVVGR